MAGAHTPPAPDAPKPYGLFEGWHPPTLWRRIRARDAGGAPRTHAPHTPPGAPTPHGIRPDGVADRIRGALQRFGGSDHAERTAIEKATAFASDRARAQEAARIARELHDELGSTLTGLTLKLQAVRDTARDAGSSIEDALDDGLREVREAASTLRRVVTSLRPRALELYGLREAIEHHAAGVRSDSGIECHIDLPQEFDHLDESLQSVIFRVVQESLTNVLRHSRATACCITARTDREGIEVRIADNGRGLGEARAANGLAGMRDRASEIGGTVRHDTAPSRGVVVTLRLPTE